MSRFPTVHEVVRSTVLAGQVGDAVHLVASRLAGWAWWNDSENDRRQSLAANQLGLHLDRLAQARSLSKAGSRRSVVMSGS
jgi:hypothetical protein